MHFPQHLYFIPLILPWEYFCSHQPDCLQDLLTSSHAWRIILICFLLCHLPCSSTTWNHQTLSIQVTFSCLSESSFHSILTMVNIYLVGFWIFPYYISFGLILFLLFIFICEHVKESTMTNLSLYLPQWLTHKKMNEWINEWILMLAHSSCFSCLEEFLWLFSPSASSKISPP